MRITREECALHAKANDCWIVISGKVYDVTQYLDEHPGGGDLILAVGGKDATADFEDAGHTTRARSALDDLCIGECEEGGEPPVVAPPLAPPAEVETLFGALRRWAGRRRRFSGD